MRLIVVARVFKRGRKAVNRQQFASGQQKSSKTYLASAKKKTHSKKEAQEKGQIVSDANADSTIFTTTVLGGAANGSTAPPDAQFMAVQCDCKLD